MTAKASDTSDHEPPQNDRIRTRKRWLTWRRGIGLTLAAALVTTAAVCIPQWDTRATRPDYYPGMVWLTGDCCISGNPYASTSATSAMDSFPMAVLFFAPLPYLQPITAQRVHLDYTIYRYDSKEQLRDYDDESVDRHSYREGLVAAGDVFTHGPVTVEVVAVHDEFFSRNNAVELKVTFDQSRIGEAP